ncbi:hypothetical protein [Georgenia sp. Z1491]|uniref:hypothetical protein n=1 Tax=Georgenia sp. Z1491 TaxID=3416707 RepID=UPI003CF83A8E
MTLTDTRPAHGATTIPRPTANTRTTGAPPVVVGVRRDSRRVPSPDALALIGALHARFDGERGELLAERRRRGQSAADGALLGPGPKARRVREDPTWRVRQTSGRTTVVARPRGWEAVEERLEVAGRPASATLVDVGLHVFDARARLAHGPGLEIRPTGLQCHREARLWHDVLTVAEDRLGLARGSVRVRIVLDSVAAGLEAEEILFELRERATAVEIGDVDALIAEAADLRARTAQVHAGCGEVGPTSTSVRGLPERAAEMWRRRYAGPASGITA